MKRIPLSPGVYSATPAFRKIKQHSCVCNADTLELVAITGPAGDKENQEYADLFAASFEILSALNGLLAATCNVTITGKWSENLRDWQEISRAAIAKAEGVCNG